MPLEDAMNFLYDPETTFRCDYFVCGRFVHIQHSILDRSTGQEEWAVCGLVARLTSRMAENNTGNACNG